MTPELTGHLGFSRNPRQHSHGHSETINHHQPDRTCSLVTAKMQLEQYAEIIEALVARSARITLVPCLLWCCLCKLSIHHSYSSMLPSNKTRLRLRDTARLLSCLLAEAVAATGEHLVEIVLEPSDVRAETGELPNTIDFLVPVGVGAVRMTLDKDLAHRRIRVFLVRHTQLVVADDLVVANLLPLGATDKVLRLQRRVAEDVGVRSHLDELIGRHSLPDLVQEGTVVDAEGRGNAFAEAVPVLAVVAVGPFVGGGHASLHVCRRLSQLCFVASSTAQLFDV